VIGREEDARDVCQETFLRAFRSINGFRGQAKFSSWLYRIALNLCRDWIRRERRSPTVQAPEGVDVIELAAEQGPTESIEDLVSRRDVGRHVAVAMQALRRELEKQGVVDPFALPADQGRPSEGTAVRLPRPLTEPT
jgi:RNA polymerase sigma-70 factor (ECF subfamily)